MASDQPVGALPSQSSSKGLKVAVFFVFLLSLTSLAGTAYLYLQMISESSRHQDMGDVTAELQGRIDELGETVVQYRATIDGMRTQLSEAVTDRQEFKSRLEQNQSLLTDLRDQLENIQNQGSVSSVPMPEPESVESSPEFGNLPVVTAAPPTPSAPPQTPVQIVAPQPAQPAVRTPEVLTVNRKFNFVVINLGSQDGMKIGDKAEIVRDGRTIGTVEIEKLYDSFSAATILKEDGKNQIREGDRVNASS